jgi:hypothetical protein
MIGAKTVAECMGDFFVLHHTAMPGVGKAVHAIHAARRLEDGLHGAIIPEDNRIGKLRSGC